MLQTLISHTENGLRSTSSRKARPKKVNTDFGSLTKKLVKKVCLYTENEFWVLGAKGSYSRRRLHGRSFKKGKLKGYGKKGTRSRPGFRPRSKGKGYAAWDNDQQDTVFWGKGKGKKGKKGMKGKDSFKGMPSWKGKGKGDGKKGGKPYQQQQPPQANVAQPASSSASSPRKTRKTRSCPSRRKLEL